MNLRICLILRIGDSLMNNKPIRVKDFECWNMSVSMLWGRTPKIEMICGHCNHYFARRFSAHEM